MSYQPTGTALARVGQEPFQHLWVIRKGAVRLERDGQTLQVLEEGETFGYTSLITGKATLDVVVEEDLVAYRIPAAAFRLLLSDAQFARHFAVGLSERLRASLEHSPVATFPSDLSVEVAHLLRREAVWVAEDATIEQAARVMRENRISSVLVRCEPPGIVTDRDLRNRVLAAGLGPAEPVTRVLSRPLQTVESSTPTYAAWQRLLDSGVHHLPVTKDGKIVGVLTSSDLLRSTAQGPVAVLRRVEHLASRDSAARLRRPGEGDDLGAPRRRTRRPRHRRLRLPAERRAGEADPHLGGGGSGPARRRPTPGSCSGRRGGWSRRSSPTRTTPSSSPTRASPSATGSRPWPSGPTATCSRPASRSARAATWPAAGTGPLSEWKQRFTGWTDVPTPKALLEASIFFDFRRVHGELDLGPLEEVLGGVPPQGPVPAPHGGHARSSSTPRPCCSCASRARPRWWT